MSNDLDKRLVEMSYEFVTKFATAQVTGYPKQILPTYTAMRHALEKTLNSEDLHPVSDDVASFVLARGAKTPLDNDKEARTLGLFSSVLADTVTHRQQQEGTSTRIVVAGDGEQFDYLFFMARNLREVFLENIQGDRIFDHVGAYGRADILVARNIQGNLTAIGAGESSRVGMLLLDTINGKNTGMNTALRTGSNVRLMIYRNIPHLDHRHHRADCIYLENTQPVRDRPEGAAFATAILEGFDGDFVDYWKLKGEGERGFEKLLQRHAPLELLKHVEKKEYDAVASTFRKTPSGKSHYRSIAWKSFVDRFKRTSAQPHDTEVPAYTH
jgi:hypothetical protein